MHDQKPARVFAFDQVDAYITPESDVIIEWRVNPRYQLLGPGPIRFWVEVAATLGTWRRLNTVPVTSSCVYVDHCPVRDNVYYRVILDDGSCEYASRPAHTMGEQSRTDTLITRDVLRKEYLRLRKFAGTRGYLLKRMEYGQRCPSCTDYDTGEVVSGSTCEVCFGTGTVHGYYDALPYYIDFMGATSTKDVKEPFGVEDNQTVAGRAIAYPRLDTYDIWVHGSSNHRFVIRQTQVIAEIRMVPMLYSLQLRVLPFTDIAYRVPMQWEAQALAQESSSSAAPACAASPVEGWRQGITFQEIW